MVRFSLATLPKNSTIQSASLVLTIYDEATGQYQLFRISKKWDPAIITWRKATSTSNWSTEGGDCFATPESSFVAGQPFFVKGNAMNFNVTNTVKNFYTDSTQNFGWLLRTKDASLSSNPYGMDFYATNHGGQEARYPKLVINYTTSPVSTNPASTTASNRTLPHFTLKGRILSLPSSIENAHVTINALNGTRVFSQSANSMQTIDISAQPSGVYLVRIKTAESCISGSIALE